MGIRIGADRLDEGKKFEADIAKSIPQHMYSKRERDMQGYVGVNNTHDYTVYSYPFIYLWELKSTKQPRIDFSNIRENQVKGLWEVSDIKGVKAGFIFNFRTLEETYYVDARKVYKYMYESTHGKKSFPVDWCRKEGIHIFQELKRTRYRYDIEGLIMDIGVE